MGTLTFLRWRRAQGRLGRPCADSIRTRSPCRERTQTKLEVDNGELTATTATVSEIAR